MCSTKTSNHPLTTEYNIKKTRIAYEKIHMEFEVKGSEMKPYTCANITNIHTLTHKQTYKNLVTCGRSMTTKRQFLLILLAPLKNLLIFMCFILLNIQATSCFNTV